MHRNGIRGGRGAGEDDVLRRLAALHASLPPTMARLSEFVGEHYLKAAFLSSRQLAAAAGVSLPTVVRFSRALGYPTFEAFREGIQDRLNFELTGVERLRMYPAETGSAGLLRRIVEADTVSLRSLPQTFSRAQFDRFVETVLQARHVVVVAFRYASPLATYFSYSLGKIRPDVQAFVHADSALSDQIRLMHADDVVIAIAFARYPAEIVSVARYARRLGRRVLAITDSPLSPLLPLADATLFAKANMLDFVGSLAAPAALINCIVSDIGIRLGRRAVDRLEALEDSAKQTGIYVQAGHRGGARRPMSPRGRRPARVRNNGRRPT